MVSQAWKDLPEEEREKFEEMGRKDKARYEMEKSMYNGPWKVLASKKMTKDATRPKRPMSAFLSFSNSKRKEVKDRNNDAKTADVSRILAEMWKVCPEEEKQQYIDEEFRLRQIYKVAMAEWKTKTEEEEIKKRDARENEALRMVLEGKLPPDPFPITSATTLPRGAEYNTKMAQETFACTNSTDNDSPAHEKLHQATTPTSPAVAAAGYPNSGYYPGYGSPGSAPPPPPSYYPPPQQVSSTPMDPNVGGGYNYHPYPNPYMYYPYQGKMVL
jgi:high mobility group protein B1